VKSFARIILLAFFLCGFGRVFGADAGNVDDYLRSGIGARNLALGRCGTADVSNSFAVYWNPAAIANLNYYEISFYYNRLYEDTSFLAMTGIIPTQWWGNFGWGILNLATQNIKGWNTQNLYTGEIENSRSVFLLSYANSPYASPLEMGISLKIANHSLAGYSDTGFGFDAGVTYRAKDNLKLGCVYQNFLGPVIKLDTKKEPFSPTLKIGTRWMPYELPVFLLCDVFWASRQNPKFSFGMEYLKFDPLKLRAGFNETEISLGFGYEFEKFIFDYAFSLHRAWEINLGPSHRVDVIWKLSSPLVKFKETVDRRVARVFKRARKYFKKKRYLYAIDEIWNTFSVDPQNVDAADLLQEIRRKMEHGLSDGKFNTPEDISYARGVLCYSEKNLPSALNELKQVYSIDPTRKEVKVTLKKIEKELRRLKREKEEKAKQMKIEELLNDGIYLYSIEDFKGAVEKLQELLKIDPENEEGKKYLKLALEEIEKRKPKPKPKKKKKKKPKPKPKPKKEKKPEIVYERNPQKAQQFYNDGLVEYSLGRIKSAIRYWKMALKYDPGNKKIEKAIRNAERKIRN